MAKMSCKIVLWILLYVGSGKFDSAIALRHKQFILKMTEDLPRSKGATWQTRTGISSNYSEETAVYYEPVGPNELTAANQWTPPLFIPIPSYGKNNYTKTIKKRNHPKPITTPLKNVNDSLYLDIGLLEEFDLADLEEFNVTENNLADCLDLHAIVISRNNNKKGKLVIIHNLSKTSERSDTEVFEDIQVKCKEPIEALNAILNKIKQNQPKKIQKLVKSSFLYNEIENNVLNISSSVLNENTSLINHITRSTSESYDDEKLRTPEDHNNLIVVSDTTNPKLRNQDKDLNITQSKSMSDNQPNLSAEDNLFFISANDDDKYVTRILEINSSSNSQETETEKVSLELLEDSNKIENYVSKSHNNSITRVPQQSKLEFNNSENNLEHSAITSTEENDVTSDQMMMQNNLETITTEQNVDSETVPFKLYNNTAKDANYISQGGTMPNQTKYNLEKYDIEETKSPLLNTFTSTASTKGINRHDLDKLKPNDETIFSSTDSINNVPSITFNENHIAPFDNVDIENNDSIKNYEMTKVTPITTNKIENQLTDDNTSQSSHLYPETLLIQNHTMDTRNSNENDTENNNSKNNFTLTISEHSDKVQYDLKTNEEQDEIKGHMYYIFGKEQIPVQFVQNSLGEIRLGIDGNSLCRRLSLKLSTFMDKLCKSLENK